MEYFDIVDENGKPTGEKKLRKDVHRDGDWHRAVDIWLVNNEGKILIQKRASAKESYPNLWEVSASGHLSSGEDSATAAFREFTEELGLPVTQDDFEFLFEVKEKHVTNNGRFLNNEIKDIFLVTGNYHLSDIHFQEEEISEVKFVTFEELASSVKNHPQNFVPHDDVYQGFFAIYRDRFHP